MLSKLYMDRLEQIHREQRIAERLLVCSGAIALAMIWAVFSV